MNSYERTMNKISGKTVDHIPACPLFMTYAAKIINEKYSDYVCSYKILVKGQMALVDKFGIDVVSCCSDAWREAADCGVELEYFEYAPPFSMNHIIKNPADLLKIKIPDSQGGGRMTDRIEAIKSFSEQVKNEIPILGWIEGPVSEAVDLYGMNEFMTAVIELPDFIDDLLDWTTELEMRFAVEQIRAGADIIGIGDAAASLVSPNFYREKIMPREKMIIDLIHKYGAYARLHICGSVNGKFKSMGETGADIIDIDHMQTMYEARNEIQSTICLAGNINPIAILRDGNPEKIISELHKCHNESGDSYMVAAGCEVISDTPEENIRAMFQYALLNK